MFFNQKIKEQTTKYLKLLQKPLTFLVSLDESKESHELVTFLDEICALSELLSYQKTKLAHTPSFTIAEQDNITYLAPPLALEYQPFILTLLWISGHEIKLSTLEKQRIKKIPVNSEFKTFINLDCHNCPKMVQNLNICAIINPKITHIIIDGNKHEPLVDKYQIKALPTVLLNNKILQVGNCTLDELLELEHQLESSNFDITIIGGGPAGIAAATYSAMQGYQTCLISPNLGGQTNNFFNTEQYFDFVPDQNAIYLYDHAKHLKELGVKFIAKKVTSLVRDATHPKIILEKKQTIITKTIIVATGAHIEPLYIPGEQRLLNKGVSYCPTCDIALYKNKNVALIGDNNYTDKIARLLSQTCQHVHWFTNKQHSIANVTLYQHADVVEIMGKNQVTGLIYDNYQQKQVHLTLDGVFIQNEPIPNTKWLKILPLNHKQEIITNNNCQTSIPYIFAAGDCTDNPNKDIITAMTMGSLAAIKAAQYLRSKT